MSFFFKSSKKQPGSALPQATRNIKSSDGPSSSIPTLNGAFPRADARPKSPPVGAGPNGSVSVNAALMEKQPSLNFDEHDSLEKISKSPSPEQKTIRDRSLAEQRPAQPPSRMPTAPGRPAPEPSRSTPDPSPYPWSQRQLTYTTPHLFPFPRYGAAVNSVAGRDGGIFIMGGLINGSTVKGDLWMIESGGRELTCYPIQTTAEGPGPRVGHASLLVGNAFIVFGGDTKTEESDLLDDTLYLLNTSTKQWSRAAPAGIRPPGRYGHTLNILGSKIYIFGGQVEGFFFNDLVAFDLNALQQASNRWEVLIQNTIEGGPPHGQIPPARTNHTVITWNDRLFLFGGTDGVTWFNDVWSYDPRTNSWTQLECIGYIPTAREGHAAALVGDVMYVFGGRTEEGNDLGDLAAFRISSRRWYTFQNMGPSPSPRSGHSMTALGKMIVVLAGEPSSAPRDAGELSLAYYLDTSKIRYPADSQSQIPAEQRIQGHRRPSGDKTGIAQGRTTPRQQIEQGPSRQQQPVAALPGKASSPEQNSPGSRLPRVASAQQMQPSRTMSPTPGMISPITEAPLTTNRPPMRPERPDRPISPPMHSQQQSIDEAAVQPYRVASPPMTNGSIKQRAANIPTPDEEPRFEDAKEELPLPQKPQSLQQQPSSESVSAQRGGLPSRTSSRGQRQPYQDDLLQETPRPLFHDASRPSVQEGPRPNLHDGPRPVVQEAARPSMDRATSSATRRNESRQEHERDVPVDSGLGSSPAITQRNDSLSKELEAEKSKTAWYASELALARKSGYAPQNNASFVDERNAENFGDDDKPLMEALLKMHAELSRVQGSIDAQAKDTAGRIAEVEKQRDAAISEAVYAKGKFAAQGGSDGGYDGTTDSDRSNDLGRKLAAALAAQTVFRKQIDALHQHKESESQARQLAEESAETAQKRATQLDIDRQRTVSELESLRGELHGAQSAARNHAANAAEATHAHQLLLVDHREVSNKLENAVGESKNHASILESLRAAVTASTERSDMLETRLEEERASRNDLQTRLNQLKSQHEDRTAEFETTSRRLRDAEELSEKHATEARSHRQAVLDGLGKTREIDQTPRVANDERLAILTQQIESHKALVRQNQTAADLASEKLRRAEERIAGLEAYQEQASREGLSVRKQMQAALREARALTEERNRLQQQVQSQQLETNAVNVQHSALKDILAERGLNASDLRRSRGIDSPSSQSRHGSSTPDTQRVMQLEQQLDTSNKVHEEMKRHLEELQDREGITRREYEEKLATLDNDHQAAAKYLRGTEKMLSKMKQELQRVKNQAAEYVEELETLRAKDVSSAASNGASPGSQWEAEREAMRKDMEEAKTSLVSAMAPLESKINSLQGDIQSRELDLETLRSSHATTQSDMATLRSTQNASRADLERLQHENAALEERARDAENKVQLLLDQVESHVDNYRRQSGLVNGGSGMNGLGGSGHRRGLSGVSGISMASSNSTAHAPNNRGHMRGESLGAESNYSNNDLSQAEAEVPSNAESGLEEPGERNSFALDSLANELDALRSHWETTNKTYRISDKFDFERSASGNVDGSMSSAAHSRQGSRNNNAPKATSALSIGSMGGHDNNAGTAGGSGLADWRRGLNVGEEEEDSAARVSRSRSRSPNKNNIMMRGIREEEGGGSGPGQQAPPPPVQSQSAASAAAHTGTWRPLNEYT